MIYYRYLKKNNSSLWGSHSPNTTKYAIKYAAALIRASKALHASREF